MKTLYIESLSGISGDMLLASLIDAQESLESLKKELSKLPLDFEIKLNEKKISGIKTKLLQIKENKTQPLRKKKEIEKIINESTLDKKIKEKSISILNILGEAEAKVHSTSIDNLHFHEIGAVDTIVDIVGSVIMIEKINPANIISSKINLGSGFVEIEHGKLPVPAPASAEIAKNILTFSTDSGMELATPTGLAILKGFTNEFASMPTAKIKKTGYGAGTRSSDKNPNIVRTFILDEAGDECTTEIFTNIDDSTPEILGHAMEKLIDEGALDVYLTPIQMKKQRQATKLSVISKNKDAEKLSKIIMKETSTTGVRMIETRRKKLQEEIKTIKVHNLNIRVKLGFLDNELVNFSPEFEDCKKVARKTNISLKLILEKAKEKAKENYYNKNK
ncbi:MAG: nickel pincer cofactor biosynthesis protein LarC [Nanoarchaeota archaeon]